MLMVMSILWLGMIVCATLFFPHWNKGDGLTASGLEGAKTAIELSFTLGGSLCLWGGISRVMEVSGLQKKMANFFRPFFCKVFPVSSCDEDALCYLSANFTANLLGLGNAATPLGIAATKRIKAKSGVDYATDELCRLVVMNTASIQLIPTTVASLRASLGGSSPMDILPAVWLTSLCSVMAGLLAAYGLQRVWGNP
ncbi:MAG: spore maturation protein A [Eubacteriales bacterium]